MSIKHKIVNKLNGAVRRTRWFNEDLFQDCKKFWNYNTFNTKVVNLGSTSAVCGFDYSDLPITGANWALRHNPLSGDRAILKNYFSYLDPNGSIVILPLCLFSSVAGRYDFMEDKFYTLIYPTSIPHFSYRRQQQIKALRNSPIRMLPLLGIYKELKHFFKNEGIAILSDEEMKIDAKQWMKGWFHEFSIQSLDDPLSLLNKDSIEEAAYILNDIISFCKERNITPIMVLPPVYHTLSEQYGEKGKSLLLDNLINKIEDKSVKYLNYMEDKRFSHNAELFKNSYLLNSKGAKTFTKIVLKDIALI